MNGYSIKSLSNIPAGKTPVKSLQKPKNYKKFIPTMPLEYASIAAKLPGCSLHVALCIWRLKKLNKSNSIKLSYKMLLDDFGIKRDAAHRALRQLELAGLIFVERQNGKSPKIEVLMD